MFFNNTNSKKLPVFILMLFFYSAISYGLIVLINLLFKTSAPMYELSPLIGGLLAGMAYGGKTGEMAPMKLRVIASVVASIITLVMMIAISIKFREIKLETVLQDWKRVFFAFSLFAFGTMFTLYLGNRNKLRSMEFKNNIKNNVK